MNIRILRVDLSETNRLLERIAQALEAQIPPPLPEQPTRVRSKGPMIGSYGTESEETPGEYVARLRAAGLSDGEIEKLILDNYGAEEETQ